jgi:hypothetical protein
MSKTVSRKKPSKPYKSFPLTAHNNGQWCKKIRGKVHFFGVWADPQAALEKYLKVAADLHSGRQPLPGTVSPEDISVKDLCNRYLNYQIERAETGEIGQRWFEDCRCVLNAFAQQVGPKRMVKELLPEDFRRFREHLVRYGLADGSKGLGVHALNRAIRVVRGVMKYAYEVDLIERPVKYGKMFDRPSAIHIALESAAQHTLSPLNPPLGQLPICLRGNLHRYFLPSPALPT